MDNAVVVWDVRVVVDAKVAATVVGATKGVEVTKTAVTAEGNSGAADEWGAVGEVFAEGGSISVLGRLGDAAETPAVDPREGKGKDDQAGVGTVTKVTGRFVANGFGSVGCRLREHHPFLTATLLSVKWKST